MDPNAFERNGPVNIESDALSTDEVYELLSVPRRRYVLAYLWWVDGAVSKTTLAFHVATGEGGAADEYECVRETLVHNHLPKLDDFGVVDYDRANDAVALADDVNVVIGEATDGHESANATDD